MPQDRVVVAERGLEFADDGVGGFDVHQNVVRLVDLVDQECQLAAAPVFEAVHHATVFLDGLGVALDHTRDLLALIRVDQKDDFIVSHCLSPWFGSLPTER